MPEGESQSRRPRGFWSGTISFGLVSVPVSMFPATRGSGVSLRMVDKSGQPLSRVYFCSKEDEPLEPPDIVRGYELEKNRFVVVEDEELEAIAPEKSQEISLERFVELDEIDPIYFQRAYILAPGKGGARPYRLLAGAMEDSSRAGIATFVMRGKEYLVAIIAEQGLLRAETLRFHDELRTPEDVGLPSIAKPDAARRKAMEKAMRKLYEDELDVSALADQQTRRLEKVVESKLRSGRDVTRGAKSAEPSERDSAEVIDLMQVLKQSVEGGAKKTSAGSKSGKAGSKSGKTGSKSGKTASGRKAPRQAGKRGDLRKRSKSDLYDQAQRLDIPGRSTMNKDQLIEALESMR